MDRVKHIVMVIVFAMVGIMIVVNVIPSLYSVTMKDVERDNENAGWIRLSYTKADADIPVSIGSDVSFGGANPQTGSLTDMIIWADSYLTVFIRNGSAHYVGKTTETVSGDLGTDFSIMRNNIRTVITDGSDTYTFPHSQYAMIPDSEGGYSSFMNGSDSVPQTHQMFVGGLMGFVAYDGMNTTDYDLVLHRLYNEDDLTGAEWRGQ